MGVLVYDTKKAKYYEIHPTMGADQTWCAQRGLIVQKFIPTIQATNIPEPAKVNDAGIEPVKPTVKTTPTKTK